MRIRYGNILMDATDAAGARGTLLRAQDQWRFRLEDGQGPAKEYLVRHDDLCFKTKDGIEAMLLSGVNGHFVQMRNAADENTAIDQAGLMVSIDMDEMAAFYTPIDGMGEALLDHSPRVLGLQKA